MIRVLRILEAFALIARLYWLQNSYMTEIFTVCLSQFINTLSAKGAFCDRDINNNIFLPMKSIFCEMLLLS